MGDNPFGADLTRSSSSINPGRARASATGSGSRRLLASPGSFFDLFLTSTEEAAQQQTGAFRQAVLEQLQQGVPISTAIKQAAFDTPGVLEDPNFPKSAQEILKLFQGPEFTAEPPGSVAFSPATGKFGEQAPGKPPEPTAAEKLTQAILAAETPEEKAILTAQLPRDPSGRLSVDDFITVMAAGVQVRPEFRPTSIKDMTQEQAKAADLLGKSTSPRAPNSIDLITRGLGGTTGTNLDALAPITARGAAIIQQNLRQTESQSFLDTLLAANPATAGLTPSRESVEGLFEKFDAGQLSAPGAGPRAEGPAQVPLAGGKAGQAAAPALQIDPARVAKFSAIPPENFPELSDETLAEITLALQSGQLQLSDEQRVALFQVMQARQGAGGGGTSQ